MVQIRQVTDCTTLFASIIPVNLKVGYVMLGRTPKHDVESLIGYQVRVRGLTVLQTGGARRRIVRLRFHAICDFR